jgi:electron transport complex protein RnfG
MRSAVIQVIVLTLVCIVSSLALALVNNLTEERIVEQKRLAESRAVKAALLQGDMRCDNEPSEDSINIPGWKDENGNPKKIFLGKLGGRIVGVAFTSMGEGYGGFIKIMMGVAWDGKLTGIEILEHLETPGLGANIDKPSFKAQFGGKYLEGSPEDKLEVIKGREAKEHWQIQALTGATISPTGVALAVTKGLKMFEKYKEQILAEEMSKGGTE